MPTRKILPVAQWTPDMPAFYPDGSQTILNVIPRTPASYGPFPQFSPYSSALTLRCQGAYACMDSSANPYVFAGDANDLYELTSGSSTFSKVSQTTGGYSCPSTGEWHMALFGQRVIATDYADPIQSFVLGTSTKFSDLANGNITALTLVGGSGYTNGTYALSVTGAGSGTGFAGTVTVAGGALSSYSITNNGKLYPQTATIAIPGGAGAGTGGSITPTIQTIAPNARYLAVIKSWLVLAYTNDATNGIQPQAVWWPSNNDPTTWPIPGTANAAALQSTFVNIVGDGGANTGIVGNLLNADGILFQQHAVWRIVFSNYPIAFQFFPVGNLRGVLASNSIIQVGGQVYALFEDGFYSFDGLTPTPIGVNRVDRTFFADLNAAYISRVVGTADPVNRLIYWAYPSKNSLSGASDKLLIYNWSIDRWSIATVSLEWIVRALTFGYTLDQLYTILGYTIDNLPAPLDDKVWLGGNLALGIIDSSNKLNFATSSPLGATVDTAELQLTDNLRSYVRESRPLVDAGSPSVNLGGRNKTMDSVSWSGAVAMNADGICPQSTSNRYIRAEITVPAGTTYTHIQGVEVEFDPDGPV